MIKIDFLCQYVFFSFKKESLIECSSITVSALNLNLNDTEETTLKEQLGKVFNYSPGNASKELFLS